MLISRTVVWMFLGAMMMLGPGGISAQPYPNKPIRIVTAGLGGSNDLYARLIAHGISGSLGQPVVIENRVTAVLPDLVAKATPDGYTTLVSGSNVWLAPLTRKAPYDPLKDLAPITILGTTPYILFLHPSLPVNSVKELIAYAKARPGELNNSVGGLGGSSHLAQELFKSMAGVKIVAVPYSSNSSEISDLIGGRVQLTFTSSATMMEQVRLGKLKALAVTSAQPSAIAPDLPTIASSGLPGYNWGQLQAMFAPGKTPAGIINRLNHEVVRFLNTAEAKERLFNAGQEVVASSPQELAATMQSETARVGKVIKDAGIKVN